MLLTAVDEQRVRRGIKARVARLIVRKAAVQRLAHGRVVVLIRQSFNLEVLIVLFTRFSVHKHHHRRDNVRPGGVGNIVAFEPVRRLGQVHHRAELRKRPVQALGARGHALRLLAGIFLRQLHHAHTVAALRHADVHLFVELLKKKLLKQRRVVHRKRQQNLLGRSAAHEIILLDERRKRLLPVVRRREQLIVLVKQTAVHIVQHRKARPRFALIIADDVGICHRPRRDELLLAERLHGAHTVAQGGGTLKFQPLGGVLHLML